MTYAVNPLVTIADVDYTSEVLNGLNCYAGRFTVDEQPRAGYATINIVDFDNDIAPIEIDQKIVIKVDDSNGNPVTIWTGWVSDVNKEVQQSGAVGYQTLTRVTGIGSLAKLYRRIVGGDGYEEQFDGDRVLSIVTETAGETWTQVNPALQWQDVNPLTNWANYDILIGTIDTPGNFELQEYEDGPQSGLILAQRMAQSGLGILYESTDGKINYSKYSRRAEKVQNDGFTQLDLDAILATGLSSVSRISDLINSIEIVYRDNAVEAGTDPTSIAVYGLWQASVQTDLEKQIDAEQRADYYLETRAFPRTSLNAITLVLTAVGTPDALRDDILGVEVSEPIAISGLPPNIYNGLFTGFVEGYTYTVSRNELFLTLNVSDFALSQLQMNWLQVPAVLTWNNTDPSLIWEEARSVS